MNKQELMSEMKQARENLDKLRAQFSGQAIPAGVAKVIEAIEAHIEFASERLGTEHSNMPDAA